MKSWRFDFYSLFPKDTMSRTAMLDVFQKHLIIKNKKLNNSVQLEVFVRNRNLYEFFSNILFHTAFLRPNAGIVERLFCFYNSIYSYPNCHRCGLPSTKFNCGFKSGYYNKFCSYRCNALFNPPLKNMSAKDLRAMHNKIGSYRKGTKFSKTWKDNLKRAASLESVKKKKRQTCLKLYGVENPGVLGAYYSSSAKKYILRFLREHNISKDYCLFHDKKSGKSEFWQMIYVPFLGKYRYFSYDLAVFENKEAAEHADLEKLELILEYNGPWHYKKEEVIGHESELGLPYKSVKKTKKDILEMDTVKLEHVIKHAKNVLIYWEKSRELLPAKDCI